MCAPRALYATPCSPVAEAPYNPHSTQRRMENFIFTVSDSASGFASINHEWACIPAFVCFYVGVLVFSFFLPALQTQSHSAPLTAAVVGAGGQRITDVRFPEGSCGRSRNRTRRLNSEATFSHRFGKWRRFIQFPQCAHRISDFRDGPRHTHRA